VSQVIEVCAPVENVNDETIAVIRWLVDDRSLVKEGTPLLLAETTKTSFDISAPATGFVLQVARAGTDVLTGSILCYIGDDLEAMKATAANPVEKQPPVEETMTAGKKMPARFTAKAMALVRELGLDPDSFAGQGLVREQDVLGTGKQSPGRRAAPSAPLPSTDRGAPLPAGVPVRAEALSRSKRYEARHLRAASSNTLPSSVTIAVPTSGSGSASRADTDIAGLRTASMIYETARLLRIYPVFNAVYAQDEIHYYEEVNIGYAIDLGKGLKVPVIRHADTRNLTEIADEKQRLLVAYLNDSLSLESLAAGTFTVTDLSGEGVAHFQPVINDGQSAILGVCAETPLADNGRGTFNLVLAFDHQLAEGRTAAAFLRDLRDRLVAHAASWQPASGPIAEPRCALCLRPAGELDADRQFLVRTVSRPAGGEELICTICLQDW
jgi:pyruvate/2-oxoglutarate dehydrogenase complex dihydrolipoamide acyltransferase (E2) component